MGLRFGKHLPKWYLIVLLVYGIVGNTSKFRETPKALCTNFERRLSEGLGENSRSVIIIVMLQWAILNQVSLYCLKIKNDITDNRLENLYFKQYKEKGAETKWSWAEDSA